MLKPVWLTCLLLLNCFSEFAVPNEEGACLLSDLRGVRTICSTVLDYDGIGHASVGYDRPSKLGGFCYDETAVLTVNGNVTRSAKGHVISAAFAEFLAAECGVQFAQQGISATFRNGEFAGQSIYDVA